MTMVRSFLEAITDHFDQFFHASLDSDAVPSIERFGLSLEYISIFGHFCIVVIFRKLKIKVQKIWGLKMVIF